MGFYSELFRNFHAAARREAVDDFRNSAVGRLAALAGESRYRNARAGQRFVRALERAIGGGGPSAIERFRFGTAAYVVEKYAREDSPGGEIVRQWLKALGPAGDLMLSLFGAPLGRANSQSAALNAAIRLVQAFGMEVLPNPSGPWNPSLRSRGRAAAWRYLRDIGELDALQVFGGVEELADLDPAVFEPKLTIPDVVSLTPPQSRPPGFEHLPETHPIWTGEFQEVQSSDVHSVAYDHRDATLYVRFHKKEYVRELGDWVPAGPGPIYGYYNVPPNMFLDLLRADSPGSWVWDHLRIRGTVAGHRFDYRLVAIAGTYVPRKATFTPLTGDYEGEYGEVFMPRLVQGPSGKWLKSRKAFEVVRTFRPTSPIPPGRAQLFGI
ncbi:KTSC domain-containing protein [Thermopirellula anaerolimosa]